MVIYSIFYLALKLNDFTDLKERLRTSEEAYTEEKYGKDKVLSWTQF